MRCEEGVFYSFPLLWFIAISTVLAFLRSHIRRRVRENDRTMQALTLICPLKLRSFESSRQGTPFFPRRTFPLPPCSPPSRSPLPSPVLATPSVVPALRVFPLSPSLPHLTQLPPVVVRSLSLSRRVALSPALLGTSVLPLVLYHYLFFTFSLVLSNVFLPSYPTYRRIAVSLRLMFKLSLSLVRALSFPSFSFSLSRSLVRRTRVLLAPLTSIFLSPSIHIHVSTSFFFYPTVSSLARSSLLPRPNAWPKRKSVSLFSFLRTFTPVSPWRTNPTTFVEAVRDSQPNLRRRTLLAPTKPPPPLRALSTECFSRSLPSALLHTSFSLALTQSHLHPSTRKRTNPAGRYVSPLSSQVPLFRARCALFQF